MNPINTRMIQISSMATVLMIMTAISYYQLKPISKNKAHCLQVVYPNQIKRKIARLDLNEEIRDAGNIRAYRTLQLTNNSSVNQHILQEFRSQVSLLKSTKDTIHGCHLIVDDKTTWQDYIQAMDICNEEKVNTYCPVDNDIWVYFPTFKGQDLFVPKPAKNRLRILHYI